LLRAKREGTIASLRKALVELETRAGFRIADGLVQQALLAADEATSDSD
jgi:predicted nucleic acid-binding protein